MHDETMANKRIDVKAEAERIVNELYFDMASPNQTPDEFANQVDEEKAVWVRAIESLVSSVHAEAARETVEKACCMAVCVNGCNARIRQAFAEPGNCSESPNGSPATSPTTEYQQAVADADHDTKHELRQFVDAAVRLADAHMEYPASGHPDDMADTETILRLAPQFREQAP